MSAIRSLLSEFELLMSQVLRVLEQVDDRRYSCRDPRAGGSIGEHLRHCLGFLPPLLAGIDSGRIDYEDRPRDPRVEIDHAFARRSVRRLIGELRRAATAWTDRPLWVKAEGHAPDTPWTGSTLGREIAFVTCHTLHHLALIATLLRLQGIEPEAGLGIAPSTLRRHATLQSCGT